MGRVLIFMCWLSSDRWLTYWIFRPNFALKTHCFDVNSLGYIGLSPDDRFEEVVDDSDEAGGVDDEAGLQVLLVPPVHDFVQAPEPREGRFVG